jgi:hypothetical protein
MPVRRMKLFCPWCGAKLKTMATAERIKEKRAPGSRIEKSVAKCPHCAKVIVLKEPPASFAWQQASLWGAGALALVVLIGLIILYLIRAG